MFNRKLKTEINSLKNENKRLTLVIERQEIKIKKYKKEENIWKWIMNNPPKFIKGQRVGDWTVISVNVEREKIEKHLLHLLLNTLIAIGASLLSVLLLPKRSLRPFNIDMLGAKSRKLLTEEIYSYKIEADAESKTVSEPELAEIQITAEKLKSELS